MRKSVPEATANVLPRWLRAILVAMAGVQAALAVAAIGFPPGDGSQLFSLPAAPIRLTLGAGFLLLGAAAALAHKRPPGPLIARLYRALVAVRRSPAWVILALGLAVLAFRYMPARWVGYPLLGVQALLAALALYLAGDDAWAGGQPRRQTAALAVVGAAGVGLRVWFMLAGVADDEGSFVSTGINLLHGGGVAPELWYMPPDAPHMPAWGYAVALYGAWMRVFGIGLLQARALGLTAGLLALPLMYLAVRRWYGSRAALVTAALAAVSFLGTQASLGRMNGLPTLFVAGALLGHVWASQQEQLWPHALTGALAVLTLEAHLLNLSVVAAFGAYYLVEYALGIRQGERWLRSAPLWAYLAGALPALAIYVAAHVLILPHPAGYLTYLTTFGDRQTVLQGIAARLSNAALRWKVFWDQSPAEVLLIAASLAAALVRRAPADRHWLLLVLFNELALVAIHPIDIVNNGYTGFYLPILLGGSGALVTQGFGREVGPGSAWERAALAGAALLLAAYTVGAIRASHQNFVRYNTARRALADAIRARVPPGEAILAIDYYVPYLLDYRLVLPPGADDSELAPLLAGEPSDAYWLGMFLDLWPRARLETHYFSPSPGLYQDSLTGSYFAARRAERVMDWLYVVPDGDLVTGSDYAHPGGAGLQMVAHARLPERVAPGETFALNTVWVTRAAVETDYHAAITLVDGRGRAAYAGGGPLVSGWEGTVSGQWKAYRFHDVRFAVAAPGGLTPGMYMLRIALSPPGGACTPQCAFDVGRIAVGG